MGAPAGPSSIFTCLCWWTMDNSPVCLSWPMKENNIPQKEASPCHLTLLPHGWSQRAHPNPILPGWLLLACKIPSLLQILGSTTASSSRRVSVPRLAASAWNVCMAVKQMPSKLNNNQWMPKSSFLISVRHYLQQGLGQLNSNKAVIFLDSDLVYLCTESTTWHAEAKWLLSILWLGLLGLLPLVIPSKLSGILLQIGEVCLS